MNYLMTAAGFLLLAAAAVIWKLYRRRIREYSARFGEIKAEYALYTAAVLDVHRERENKKTVRAIIVQFRIEAEKRTVIHRITERFYGKYKRGDRVDILFLEGSTCDKGLIADDNIYLHAGKNGRRICFCICLITAAAGIITIIAGICGLF